MSSSAPRPARRRRLGGVLFTLGVMALFLATWAVPEGIIHVARATAEEAPIPMSGRAWFAAIAGPVSLVLGGVLSVAGHQLARAPRGMLTPEDLDLDERWGDEELIAYDPTQLQPGHRSARRGPRGRWD